MAKLLYSFCATEFLGALFMTMALCCLLIPTFYSWFASKSRRFWFFNLTYENPEDQTFVRSTWIAGILLFAIGAIVASVTNPDNSENASWIFSQIAFLIAAGWVMLKAILLTAIIILSLWDWALHGKSGN